jgi:hypothetical protein
VAAGSELLAGDPGGSRSNEEKLMDQHQRSSRVGRRRRTLTIAAIAVGTVVAGGAFAATTGSADTSDGSAGGFLCYTVDAYGRVNRLCGAVPLYYLPY